MTELPSILVVMALKDEGQGEFEAANIPVLYTGVGKVNAAFTLTRHLALYRHAKCALPLVVNFGSAGSRRFNTGSLVACSEFVQRDMDVSGLGFAIGETPFEHVPAKLTFPLMFKELPQTICGSGDSFAMSETRVSCDVIDMEAYALAKACWLEGASFACAKYITDGADHAAADDWQANLHKAAAAFVGLYRDLSEGRSSNV